MYLKFSTNGLFKVQIGRADGSAILNADDQPIVNTMARNSNEDSVVKAVLKSKDENTWHLAYRLEDEPTAVFEAQEKEKLYATDNIIDDGIYRCRMFKKEKLVSF